MIEYNKEYFQNNCYFFLKDKGNTISLYYSIADNLVESRKKDEKKDFKKKDATKIKKIVHKFLNKKGKPTKKEVESELNDVDSKSEIEELVDTDGTMLSSKVPILQMPMHPKKTTDQTIPMARTSNDPVTRGYRVYWGESEEKDEYILNEEEMSTYQKLIRRAERDGFIRGDYGRFIYDSAKKVANAMDELDPEQQELYKDSYYKKFLELIGKKRKINEVDFSDAFGYEETKDKDYKSTKKTLKKMGIEDPTELEKRVKQLGKLRSAKVKKDKKDGKLVLKQRLTEKDSLEEEQKKRVIKMVEDILSKRKKDSSDVVKKKNKDSDMLDKSESGIKKIISKNLKSIKNMADKEGISINQLISILKSDE